MPNLNSYLVDKVVQSSLDVYSKLPKTGKPIENEWTVLSCIIKYDSSAENIEVVSLGTGSKCIGSTKMSAKGDILNDSHAEVFARRGFLLYLYDNIHKAIECQPSIFIKSKNILKLKSNVEFIFYSSQLPCGDASIIPKTGEEENFGNILLSNKRSAEDICDIELKKQKVNDVHRTGAKCLPHSQQDSKEDGINYHTLGQVRTKPGRGDKTLSVSCSDKIARWIHVGIQGSLLDMIIEPIYIKYFIFGAGVPYYEESLNRALLTRSDSSLRPEVVPKFYQSSITYPFTKTEDKIRPAPGSIVWVKMGSPLLEVAVHGRKLGVTKKKGNTSNNLLCICKYNMYKQFLLILNKCKQIKEKILFEDESGISYNKMKKKSRRYLENWSIVKEKFFKTWNAKPDMWDFCVLNLT